MKTKLVLLFLIPFFSTFLRSQDNLKAFYIGHSLSDGIIDMVNSLSADHPSLDFSFRYQTIPGSPLRWNWQAKDRDDYTVNNPFYCGFYHEEYGLSAGDFDVLVLTESVPRYRSIIDDTYQYADSFYLYATTYNPDIRIYIYEVWHCILSDTPNPCHYDVPASPWRQRLTDDLPMWESVVDTLNSRYNPVTPVCLIPAGQGLATLYDSIQAGVIPGISSMNDLFADDIHLNDLGRYFVACIHFSMIHGITPEGLTNQLHGMWGNPYTTIPTPAQALKFQKMAWDVANHYPNSCLNSTTSNEWPVDQSKALHIYPNPTNDFLNIHHPSAQDAGVIIYNLQGQVIYAGKENKVDVSHFPAGVYFLRVDSEVRRFVKG